MIWIWRTDVVVVVYGMSVSRKKRTTPSPDGTKKSRQMKATDDETMPQPLKKQDDAASDWRTRTIASMGSNEASCSRPTFLFSFFVMSREQHYVSAKYATPFKPTGVFFLVCG